MASAGEGEAGAGQAEATVRGRAWQAARRLTRSRPLTETRRRPSSARSPLGLSCDPRVGQSPLRIAQPGCSVARVAAQSGCYPTRAHTRSSLPASPALSSSTLTAAGRLARALACPARATPCRAGLGRLSWWCTAQAGAWSRPLGRMEATGGRSSSAAATTTPWAGLGVSEAQEVARARVIGSWGRGCGCGGPRRWCGRCVGPLWSRRGGTRAPGTKGAAIISHHPVNQPIPNSRKPLQRDIHSRVSRGQLG